MQRSGIRVYRWNGKARAGKGHQPEPLGRVTSRLPRENFPFPRGVSDAYSGLRTLPYPPIAPMGFFVAHLSPPTAPTRLAATDPSFIVAHAIELIALRGERDGSTRIRPVHRFLE